MTRDSILLDAYLFHRRTTLFNYLFHFPLAFHFYILRYYTHTYTLALQPITRIYFTLIYLATFYLFILLTQFTESCLIYLLYLFILS